MRLTFLAAAWLLASPAVAAPACQPATFKIALDVGHYRASSGATSARGVTEFTYNRQLAEAVLAALRELGFEQTFLVGESGDLMPLEHRSQIARDEKAALFISLHHDSAQRQYFSTWTFEGRQRSYSDNFHGYSIFVSARSKWAKDSMALATMLGQDLEKQGLTPSLHHAEPIPGEGRILLDRSLGIYRFDQLSVLRNATMPALLLESAVIVNRDEEQQVISGAYHPRVVTALVQAITQYCTSR